MKMRRMKVETGSFKWCGVALNVDEAIIAAFADGPPEKLGLLVRIHDGYVWHYIASDAALRLAGYKVAQNGEGQ